MPTLTTTATALSGAPNAQSVDRDPAARPRRSLGHGLGSIFQVQSYSMPQAIPSAALNQASNLAESNESGWRDSQAERSQRRGQPKATEDEPAASIDTKETLNANGPPIENDASPRVPVYQPTSKAVDDYIKPSKKRDRAKNRKPAADSGAVTWYSKTPQYFPDDVDPPLAELLQPVHTKDTVLELVERVLRFTQLFGELCKDIVTQLEKERPPAPNGHIEFIDFVDPIEKQFRKEYHHLRLASFNHFFIKFHLEPATNSKVQILEDGYSMPKFFKIKCEWAATDLIPIRLCDRDGIRFVELRFDGRWQRLSAFLDTLAHVEPLSYNNMSQYWAAVQEKKVRGFPFMELPLELRQIVYRRAMFYRGTTIHPHECQGNWESVHNHLPGVRKSSFYIAEEYNWALLKVSKQIKEEAINEFYRRATFHLDSARYLTRFIASKGLRMVGRLELDVSLHEHESFVRELITKDGCQKTCFESPALARLRRLTIIVSAQRWFNVGDDVLLTIEKETNEEIMARREREEAGVEQLRKDYSKMLAHLKHCELVMLT